MANYNFIRLDKKLPPIGKEIEVKEYSTSKVTKNTLLKVEWVDQKVAYTWAKGNAHYIEWRPIQENKNNKVLK